MTNSYSLLITKPVALLKYGVNTEIIMLSARKKKIIHFQLSQHMNSEDKGNHGGITGANILN